jgi:hypothetical protein
MRAVFQLLVNELLLERADRDSDANLANFEAVRLASSPRSAFRSCGDRGTAKAMDDRAAGSLHHWTG